MGNVYFARSAGLIKIGFTQDVGQRLCQLQTGNPAGIEIVAVLTDVRPAVERHFHEYFEAARARGEWFNPTIELLSVIAHVQGGARPVNSHLIEYYANLPPNVRLHDNPHIDVRLSAKQLFASGYEWPAVKQMLVERGPGYTEAIASFERVLTRRKKSS